MTKLIIDLSDVAGETHPEDTVVVWSPVHREGSAGRTVSPTQHTIRLTEGKGEREVEPGPLMVQTHVRAIADTRPKEVVVPDQDTVTLWDLLEQGFTYTPPIISEVTEARAEVREAVARVGTAEQVGQWAEDAQTAETNASTAASDALTIKNSIPGTVTTEVNRQVPPKVAEVIAGDSTVTDAAAAAVEAAAEDIRWPNGNVPASTASLDDLDVGVWGVASATVARNIGIPTGRLGTLQILPIASGRTAIFLGQEAAGDIASMWVASHDASRRWAPWHRVYPPETEEADALKRVPLALTAAVGGDGLAAGKIRYLAHFGAPVSRFRVHVSNVHPRTGATRGPLTIYGGILQKDPAGAATWVSSVFGGRTEVPDGGEAVSQWIQADLTQPHGIQLSYRADQTQNTMAACWVEQSDGTWQKSDRGALFVWLEAETYFQTPTVALIGDSTGAGQGSDEPVHGSAIAIEGRRRGFLPILYSHSGDTLAGNISLDDHNFARWKGMASPDSVVIQAGSNDLNGGASLPEMKTRFAGTAGLAKKLAPVVLAGTIKPRYPNDDASVLAVRTAYNDWLETQPEGVRGVVDFDAAVAPGGTVDAADSADAAHLTASGHQKMSQALSAVNLSRPGVVGPADLEVKADQDDLDQRVPEALALRRDTTVGTRIMAGDTMIFGDTGWRDINSLITGIEFSGSVLVRRRAEWLDFRFAWFNPTGVANVGFTLPSGWRGVNNDGAILLNGSGAYSADLRIGWGGDVTIRRTTNQSLDCTVSIPSHPTWPATNIGTPA